MAEEEDKLRLRNGGNKGKPRAARILTGRERGRGRDGGKGRGWGRGREWKADKTVVGMLCALHTFTERFRNEKRTILNRRAEFSGSFSMILLKILSKFIQVFTSVIIERCTTELGSSSELSSFFCFPNASKSWTPESSLMTNPFP